MIKLTDILSEVSEDSIIRFLKKYKTNKPFNRDDFDGSFLFTDKYQTLMDSSDWANHHREMGIYDGPDILIDDVITSLEELDTDVVNGNTGVVIERAMGIDQSKSYDGVGIYWAFAFPKAYGDNTGHVIYIKGIGSLNDLDFDAIIGSGIDRGIVAQDFENELRFKKGSVVIIDSYKLTESDDWIEIQPVKVLT